MITRNGMIGLVVACAAAIAGFAITPAPAFAGEGQLTVSPAVYRVAEEGASAPRVQLVRRYYYGGPGGGYYRPRYRPYVYAPPPVVTYGYSYPAYGYGYGYPAYGYGYPPPAVGYGYYGPRVGVGVGIW